MKISAAHTFDNLRRMIAEAPDQVRFATALALTRTAQDVKKAEEDEMRDIFDRPTQYTMSSIFMKSATKANLQAEVWLKDFAGKATAAAEFLMPQIVGGTRRIKRFERAMQSVGAMPDGYRIVPGSAAKLDANGNLDRGQIVQILSYFKAFPEAGYKANMTDKRRQQLAKGSKARQGFVYFVGRPGDRLPLGVWQRVRFAGGSAIKPVMIFVPHATYEAIFNFEYVGKITMDRKFNQHFEQAFEFAKKSAR
jgi:hypothetical protein